MSEIRKIKKIYKNKPVVEGAGVYLNRLFGFTEPEVFDPFLLMDDFRSDDPNDYNKGFPWHPHRGIETITYVLAGNVEHSDSMGNKGVIGPGDVQWMTAGSGIIHQEMPEGDKSGKMHGFQLWANLPAAQKMMDPRYREISSDTIPEVKLENGVKVKVIAGNLPMPHTPPSAQKAKESAYLSADHSEASDINCHSLSLNIDSCERLGRHNWMEVLCIFGSWVETD